MDPGFASFDKLQEVGVSPYLCFIPILSVFQCFGWLEALNGRLISPKAWDRIDLIFLTQYEMVVTAQKLVGCLCGNFALNSILVSIRPEMGKKFGSKK